MSTPPSGADGIVIVRKPAIVAVAGFVPCAESGTSTSGALVVAARAVVGADHQDAGQLAVGAGRRLERDRVHAADLGERCASSSNRSSRVPWATASGAIGWRPAKPGRRAAHSLSLGLNFIVHEPSG